MRPCWNRRVPDRVESRKGSVMSTSKAKYIIGAIIVIAFGAWGASSFFESTVAYVGVEEAMGHDRMIQVMGKVDIDKVRYEIDANRLEFTIYDVEADNPQTCYRLPVVYDGQIPGNFEQAQSVVIKGTPDPEAGHFVADQILVKCPSKYQGTDSEEWQDIQNDVRDVGV